jgi:hypothetical protein
LPEPDVAELLEDSGIFDPTEPNVDAEDDFADLYADPGEADPNPDYA